MKTGKTTGIPMIIKHAGFIGLAFSIILLGVSLSHRPSANTTPAKILLIGIDGATWSLIEPLIDEGKLPNIKKLMINGSYGKLRSIEPMVSPALWTTIATGKTFEKHGIHSFVEIPPGLSDPIPVTSNMRKCKAIWNILTKKNRRSITVDYYVTYPPEEINGIMISRLTHSPEWAECRKTLDDSQQFPCMTYPPEVENTINTLVSNINNGENVPDDLQILQSVTKNFISHDWDFFTLYIRSIDVEEHLGWKYLEPEKFTDPRWKSPPEEQEKFGHIKELYIRTDALIGDLLSQIKGDIITIIVSDHGMEAAAKFDPENPNDSGVHNLDGIVILSGKGIKKGLRLEAASVLDITPTLLYLFDLPVARDMDGKVLFEAIEPVLRKEKRITYIETYDSAEDSQKNAIPVQSPFDKKIVDRLKMLGYLQ